MSVSPQGPDHERLIDGLAHGLRPVRRPAGPIPTLALWLLLSWGFVIAVTMVGGPLRPGFEQQLQESGRFALESLLAFTGAAVAMWGALLLGIPSPRPLGWRLLPGLLLLGAWVGLLVFGLYDPALPPSMLGKRPACVVEALVFSLGPLALAIALLRRRAVIRRAWTGALVGAAAGAIPALIMQFACAYDPAHDLAFHVAPGLVTMALGALAGARLLPRI